MTTDIIRKISDELTKGVESEAQVLYLLVEIRKARLANPNNSKTLLDFYRDWACHVELRHNNAVGMFLDKFEPLVDTNLDAHQIAAKFIQAFPAFFKLDELRAELRGFFLFEGLSTELTDDSTWWSVFVKHLMSILKDCSVKRQKASKGLIRELILELDKHGEPKYKFHITGKATPVCKLKWK
ncbi:hypothetical protein HYS00_01530 [Candidatus Microgenomates bacterium]|nr:hypothetical protein [Candidatus Microgenomates bacterium]